jgi:hypothetical protein
MAAVVIGSGAASATPPPQQNQYSMHLLFTAVGRNNQMQLNAGIARIEWGKTNGSWGFTLTAADQDGSAHGLGIPNYTPKCVVHGDREDVALLYEKIHAGLRGMGEVICTGSVSAPATTTVDLKSGQGNVTILETP